MSDQVERQASLGNLIAAAALLVTVMAGGWWYQADRLAAVDRFHTAQRVRVWDRLERMDAQREAEAVQLAALRGEISAIRATVQAIYVKLTEREK